MAIPEDLRIDLRAVFAKHGIKSAAIAYQSGEDRILFLFSGGIIHNPESTPSYLYSKAVEELRELLCKNCHGRNLAQGDK